MAETPKWVRIGKVIREWGVKGQVRAVAYNPDSTLFSEKNTLYLKEGDTFRPYWVEAAQPHGKFWLIKFSELDGPEAVATLRQAEIAIPREELAKAKPGEFYLGDLEGLRVLNAAGQELGHIRKFITVGDSEVMQIMGDGREEYLIPYRSEFVERTSIEEGVIVLKKQAEAFL